mmetsp:Transcript_15959/g.60373  ORF Transcript_15959/g.60373 Transcript_15959/m.60373 type:complete len:234 (+) Transcript_15959:743-1444(+)
MSRPTRPWRGRPRLRSAPRPQCGISCAWQRPGEPCRARRAWPGSAHERRWQLAPAGRGTQKRRLSLGSAFKYSRASASLTRRWEATGAAAPWAVCGSSQTRRWPGRTSRSPAARPSAWQAEWRRRHTRRQGAPPTRPTRPGLQAGLPLATGTPRRSGRACSGTPSSERSQRRPRSNASTRRRPPSSNACSRPGSALPPSPPTTRARTRRSCPARQQSWLTRQWPRPRSLGTAW